jgi:hypothetical protein
MGKTYDKWLDTFVEEKGLNQDQLIVVNGDSGKNLIPLAVVLEHIKISHPNDQKKIRTMLVQLDFKNADVMDFFKHIAKALAK